MRVRVDCKHCREDTKLIPVDSQSEETRYYCSLNKMVDGSCPEDCEWYLPSKTFVV